MVHAPLPANTVAILVLLALGAQRTAAIPVNRGVSGSGASSISASSATSSTPVGIPTSATVTPTVGIANPDSYRIGLTRTSQSKSGNGSPGLEASDSSSSSEDHVFHHSSNPPDSESSVPTRKPKSGNGSESGHASKERHKRRGPINQATSTSISARNVSEVAHTALKDAGKFALNEGESLAEKYFHLARRGIHESGVAEDGEEDEFSTTPPTTATLAAPAQTGTHRNGNSHDKTHKQRLSGKQPTSESISGRSVKDLAHTASKDPKSKPTEKAEEGEESTSFPTAAVPAAPGTSHWSGQHPHPHTQIHTHAHSRRNSSKVLKDIGEIGKIGKKVMGFFERALEEEMDGVFGASDDGARN
ncbi:hypothetical protein GYMLUDRAFT_980399 [Collybiopsis luxurians FD-317 M1]|nr:hypothetical protein GYMLUDRAFT_980399 [Collybiopsis luxurians FD-317 M1]